MRLIKLSLVSQVTKPQSSRTNEQTVFVSGEATVRSPISRHRKAWIPTDSRRAQNESERSAKRRDSGGGGERERPPAHQSVSHDRHSAMTGATHDVNDLRYTVIIGALKQFAASAADIKSGYCVMCNVTHFLPVHELHMSTRVRMDTE